MNMGNGWIRFLLWLPELRVEAMFQCAVDASDVAVRFDGVSGDFPIPSTNVTDHLKAL